MRKHMRHIVLNERRSFSYSDFHKFEVDGQEYQMAYGTFRNKVSAMMKRGEVEVVCYSPHAFYTLKGVKFDKPMTRDHAGVVSSLSLLPSICSDLELRSIKNHPLYRLIQNTPFNKSALHDIRLRFTDNGIWSILSNNSALPIDIFSKDIRLKKEEIDNLDIQVTIHHSDTVSVVIGCSYVPVAIDVNGVIRLSNALTLVEERLANMVDNRGGRPGLEIPNHKDWIVTMWHFGADASILYKGKMFDISWKIAERVLVAFYSKMWKDSRYQVRAERQEYPNKPLDEALEEKLYANSGRKESEVFFGTSDHKESQELLSLSNRREEPHTNSFFRSAADDLQRTEQKRISTGSKRLDELLDGGLEIGVITEFYGAPKTGKTHLCHLLCIALPQPFRVMYVDTEGTFQKQKIESIAQARNLDWKNILSRIQLARPRNIKEQELTIREACSVLKSNSTSKIKLLIIDSLIFHYRSEYIGRAKLLERQQRLNQQMHLLSDLATTNDVAVVITNHLYSDPNASSLGDRSKPLGGNIVSYMTKCIIKLEYLDHVYRRAILEKSPCRGHVSRYLRIAENGLRDEGPRFIEK